MEIDPYRGWQRAEAELAKTMNPCLVIIYPFDEEGRMVGEDPYTDGNAIQLDRIRKLAPDEIPEPYFRSYPIARVAAT
jgi:hypothetical protein